MTRRTFWIVLLLPVALALGAAGPALAGKAAVYTGTFNNLAVSGYDPVAYFTQGKPVEGSRDFEHEWNGAVWRFASRENLNTFKADPEAYAPQYGGYCAWAVSQGYTASTVPEAWRIVDGKLYLNYSKGVQAQWEQDVPGNIAKADTNWPKVLQ